MQQNLWNLSNVRNISPVNSCDRRHVLSLLQSRVNRVAVLLFVHMTADGFQVALSPRWLSSWLSLDVTRSYRVAKSGTSETSGINTVTQFGFGCSWSAVRTSLSFLLLQEILLELSAKRIRLWWACRDFSFPWAHRRLDAIHGKRIGTSCSDRAITHSIYLLIYLLFIFYLSKVIIIMDAYKKNKLAKMHKNANKDVSN